jgi:hypothetical protein
VQEILNNLSAQNQKIWPEIKTQIYPQIKEIIE